MLCSSDQGWPETPANMVRTRSCDSAHPGTIYRACLKTGEWSPVMSQCRGRMERA